MSGRYYCAALALASCLCTVIGVHDSFNFELLPMKRECFFEDFNLNTPVKTVEAFVQSGGNLDVVLTIHGPLDLADIRSVRAEFLHACGWLLVLMAMSGPP